MKSRQFITIALFVTMALQPIPHAPTLHDISNVDGDGDYTVSWSYDYIDPPVDRYTLQEATDADFTTNRTDYDPGSSTSYAISGKGSGTYYYRVRGHNLLWAGEWSNVESVMVGSSLSYYAYLPTVFRNQEDLPEPVTPNDTYYSAYQWNLPQIEAPHAWALSTGSGDVIVAVLDTGVDLDHPDLQGKTVSGRDFVNNDSDASDDEGHGTHVAGIVAARTNNSRGVAGVSWESKIMPVKVLDWSGSGTHSEIAEGIRWAADHGAHIINLSLGGESGSTTLQNAVNYAYNRGALMVASAGNSYQEGNPVIYPAAYPHVLAVAATGDQDEHASYSETGSYVDVAAPGGNPTGSWDSNPNHWIMSTYLGGSGYAQVAGTSQAAPHVAGLAALIWSVSSSLSNDQVEQTIEETAVDLGDSGRDNVFGHGRIDAHSALVRASSGALAAAPTMAVPSSPAANAFASPMSMPRVPVRGTESTEGEFEAGVVLVKFRPRVGEATISSMLAKYPIRAIDQIPALGVLRLSVPEGGEIEISQGLSLDPAVEYAEPDYLVRAF
jgi:type VII secretion-associated serine protease mycosin